METELQTITTRMRALKEILIPEADLKLYELKIEFEKLNERLNEIPWFEGNIR